MQSTGGADYHTVHSFYIASNVYSVCNLFFFFAILKCDALFYSLVHQPIGQSVCVQIKFIVFASGLFKLANVRMNGQNGTRKM